MSLKPANLVNFVSDSLFRAYFGFYDKKQETFMLFFHNIFLEFIK